MHKAIELARSCLATAQLFEQLGVEHERLEEASQRAHLVFARAAVLRDTAESDPKRGALVAEVNELATGVANRLRGIDDDLPFAWLRERLPRWGARDKVESYAAVMLRGELTTRRLDRVELLLTRFLTRDGADDDEVELVVDADVRAELERLLPTAAPGLARREKARAALASLRRRITDCESLSSLFADGTYLELRRLKLALGEARLDLEVVLEAARVNVLLSNRVRAEADAGSVELRAIDQRFHAGRAIAAQQPTSAQPRARQAAVALGVVLALGGGYAFWLSRPAAPRIVPVSAARAQGVHDMIVAGGYSGRGGPRIFMGELDPKRFWSLDVDARQVLLADIAMSLLSERVRDAVLSCDNETVGQILDGRVVLVSSFTPLREEATR